jgi:hypothetical protein
MATALPVAAFSLQSAAAPFAIAAAILVITAGLLVWSGSARRSHEGPGTVIFARSPWQLIVGALVTAGCVAGVGILGMDGNNPVVLTLILVAMFALVFALQFTAPALVFWAADNSGLTRQWLGFKKMLPWHTIDWVYPEQKTTTYRTYGIKTGRSTVSSLIIEAGPRSRLKLVVRAWLVGGDSGPLVEAIQQRATNALFGFDKYSAVQQRRAMGGTAGTP